MNPACALTTIPETWALCGETTVVRATDRCFSLNMILAVNPRGQMRFLTHTGTCTVAIFRDFSKHLLASSFSSQG